MVWQLVCDYCGEQIPPSQIRSHSSNKRKYHSDCARKVSLKNQRDYERKRRAVLKLEGIEYEV